jgi:hypothetical protein
MVHSERTQVIADIRTHLRINGSRNWAAVRGRYDSIPPATWWRLVRAVKEQLGVEHVISCPRQLSVEPVTTRQYRRGRGFDLLAAFHSLFTDAERLRAHCLDGDGGLRNPVVFDRSIRTRLKLLKQAVKLEQQILNVTAQQAFYEALIAEIAAESPKLQRRLINRLRGFSSQGKTREPSEARSAIDGGRLHAKLGAGCSIVPSGNTLRGL